ncbi:MAG: Integrase, catalytic region [Blastococcus sp.]|nr:Integrase, catalytic region [Blastococcus sp.]
MSHRNARTTVHGRKLIVARYRAGWRKAHIATAMGISRKCVRTWIFRYAAEGEAGLADRSSRPLTSPTRTPAEVEDRIIELRRRERRGPAWLGAELGVPARTVSRVLVRRGQPRLCTLDPMTGHVIRSPKATATRYERSRPGELVHMDVKKLGRIPDGGGWRALGRAARETTRNRSSKLGYDYVHSLGSFAAICLAYTTVGPGWCLVAAAVASVAIRLAQVQAICGPVPPPVCQL